MRKLAKYNKLFILMVVGTLMPSNAFADQHCTQVDKVKVQGVSKELIKPVLKITRKFEKQCLKGEDIKNLVRQLTNYYIECGYITSRVTLPEQNLENGDLLIEVKEGYVEDIEVKPRHKGIFPFLAVEKNKILSLRDIEQTYDQYNNGLAKNVKIDLEPGKKLGTTKVVINSEPSKKWHLVSGIDNSGTKGEQNLQSFNNLTFGNVIGLNESLNLNWRTSLADPAENYSNVKGASLSVPLGYYTISYSYSLSKERNLIKGRNLSINRGGSNTHKLGISRVIHRNAEGKTSVSIEGGKDIYESFLDQNRLSISSYKITKLDLGISHERKLTASILSLAINITNGINNGYYALFNNIGVPEKIFAKINFTSSWLKPTPVVIFDKNLQYRTQFSGQYSPHRLVASEKFSLGGLSSIRGFKEYRENPDNALLLRNELIGYLPTINNTKLRKFTGDISIFTAFDISHFDNYEEFGRRRGVMSGIAAGIRNNEGIINFNMTLAMPFHAPLYYKHKNVFYMSFGINI